MRSLFMGTRGAHTAKKKKKKKRIYCCVIERTASKYTVLNTHLN
jgi:hypothetical protein